MLSWVLQITIVSFILIFLVHHLFNFFKSTLTVPKIKDLVNSPTQKYEDIYKTINHNKGSSQQKEYTLIDLLPHNEDEMITINDRITANERISVNDRINMNDRISLNDIGDGNRNHPTMKNELKNFLKSHLQSNNLGL